MDYCKDLSWTTMNLPLESTSARAELVVVTERMQTPLSEVCLESFPPAVQRIGTRLVAELKSDGGSGLGSLGVRLRR